MVILIKYTWTSIHKYDLLLMYKIKLLKQVLLNMLSNEKIHVFLNMHLFITR